MQFTRIWAGMQMVEIGLKPVVTLTIEIWQPWNELSTCKHNYINMETPRITGTRYVLAVKDLAKSVEFYKNKLGFSTHWEDGIGWHQLYRDNFVVMLGECADDRSAFETLNHSYFAYVDVQNIDDLYAEFSRKEVEVFGKPEDKPWGQREFGIRTVDGHRMMFGQPI